MEKIKLDEKIYQFLSGYRAGSEENYGFFLRSFLPELLGVLSCDDISEIDVKAAEKYFEDYSRGRKHKASTIRSHRFALRSFLRFVGCEIGPEDFRSDPWTGQVAMITEPEFRAFLDTIRVSEKQEIAEEACLISCLAYYGGLSLNEILKLNLASFRKLSKGYFVHVTAVSRKDKERDVELPKSMNNELTVVLDRDRNPLFPLAKYQTESVSFAAKKLKIQRIIAAAGKRMIEEQKPARELRFNLKAFRTYRIYADLLAGEDRKDVMKKYGVTEFYISHLLNDSEENALEQHMNRKCNNLAL